MSPQSAPVSPTLGEGIPREGMVGDNIVAGLRGDHCGPDGGPTHSTNFGSGTELFAGNHVYLECRGAEISGRAFA